MKIIKHGEVIHFVCPVCGCEYMAREEETYKKPEEPEYFTVCPDCGESDVPGYKEQLSPDVEEQQADIERLNTENKRFSDMLRIMFNRCISFRGSENCDECAQREECESKRGMYKGWYLKDRKRVEKGHLKGRGK